MHGYKDKPFPMSFVVEVKSHTSVKALRYFLLQIHLLTKEDKLYDIPCFESHENFN